MNSSTWALETQRTLSTLLPFLLMIALGVTYRLRPAAGFPAEQVRKTIATLAMQILFPCMAFRVMSEAPWDWNLIRTPLIALLCTLSGLALFWMTARSLETKPFAVKLAPRTWASLALASAWGNVTYLGIPLITARFPENPDDGTRVALLFDLFSGSPSLFFWSALFSVTLLRKPEGATLGIRSATRESIRSLMHLRPLWAAFAGLIWGGTSREFGWETPIAIQSTLKLASSALPPLMIFAIGLALPRPQWSQFPRVIPSVGIKLFALPLVAVFLTRTLAVDPVTSRLIVFEAALPTMALTLVLSDRYGFDTETLAQAIVLSTLCLPFSLSILSTFGFI